MKTLYYQAMRTTAACLLLIGMSNYAEARPHYGGECRYCHSESQPDAMTITGETSILDGLKMFEVEPGGSVDFGFDVTDPGMYYRTVLRGLGSLNGAPYLPYLYTPDPNWQTASSSGAQYLYSGEQFYGQGAISGPTTYSYHLEVDPAVAPGLYDLKAYVAGGFPQGPPGATPTGGWNYYENFQLRVIPEPGSVALLAIGSAVFCLGGWRRKRAAVIALLVVAGAMTSDVAQAYPSRSGDCSICHSNPGPSQGGDFDILDLAGNPVTSYTAAAGDALSFRFDITNLIADPNDPSSFKRGYMVLDKLDLISVAGGTVADIPYTTPKYEATDHENWHTGRNGSYYWGQYGQYFAQSTTDPNASLLFPLTLGSDVVPGTYGLTVKLAGGRPSDPAYLNGWTTSKNFALNVTAPMPLLMTVPEPGTLLLLASAVPVAWLCGRRRRHGGT